MLAQRRAYLPWKPENSAEHMENMSNDSEIPAEIEVRIQRALEAACEVLRPHVSSRVVNVEYKRGDDPVTEADRVVNRILQQMLLRDGEGWFSEETVDDFARLRKERVWIVDPLDGTREFVARIPEWCISVAMVENGKATAAGICNPMTQEVFLSSRRSGVTRNGQPCHASQKDTLSGAIVLASRSEVKRGEWDKFQGRSFNIRPTGSVAYKLALVASGLADATWTLCPKHEWDVAAGVALVLAGGGIVWKLDHSPLLFNNKQTLMPGLVACVPRLKKPIETLLESIGAAPSPRIR
jgi:myo-inositol-1(or 4)-monophosphatase